ncbi:PAAR domain-containing protein [Trinickia fusca]|uniref:PAAR domain-containing protein n=1 Tax=Trinickia fusca TaxID=2419777 RepID=A0A494X7Y3_9BURK|nr:PAAR domain-containing protein [Trinickia fusca]RKP46817.1 PAAR domain-containing protein [Trinickia fusca]
MLRRIAVVGDSLEHGGQILPYVGPVVAMGNAGHQVALIGGQAYCEACKRTGLIAKTGGPRRLRFMGETAADGDVVLCSCSTPPRIVATLAGESWCDDMADTMGVVSPTEAAGNSVATAGGGIASAVTGTFDEQVRATESGASEGYPYFVEASDGQVFSGRLDEHGHLPRVYTYSADDYTVYWGDEALAKQDGI